MLSYSLSGASAPLLTYRMDDEPKREGGSEECSVVMGGYMYEKCGFLFVDVKYVHCIYIRVYILLKGII